MQNAYFYVIIVFFVADFLWGQFLSHLNRSQMSPRMPQELEGIYEPEAYAKQQAYQRTNSRFGMISGGLMFAVTGAILLFGGAGWLDAFLRGVIGNEILLSVAFFWVLSIGAWVIGIPFACYDTFVIEEKFGFNTTTPRTFAADEVKKIALTLVLEAVLIGALAAAYEYVKGYSWLWAWAFVSAFSLILAFFYSEWIVPLFNKQTPLEEGELRSAIETFARETAFPVHNIYVIDGSKRSTKSNAYFTGFGRKKRIVLYDTLIRDLETEEIVAVLAHEIGHYKKKHVIYSIVTSLATTGFMLWALGLFLENPAIAYALGGTQASFHLSMAGFSLLYSPLSELIGFAGNCVSRRNEYAADNFAAAHGMGTALISGLKKISAKSLSNLTPHPFVVLWCYSHPTLLQRMRNIQNNT